MRRSTFTWNCSWNSAAECGDGGQTNFGWGSAFRAALSGCHHVWFQQSTFQVYMMIVQCFVHGGQNGFGDLLAAVQIVITIGQNFWLNNWNDAICLANGCIACENVGIFQNGLVAWGVFADFQYATPFGEVASILFVLCATGIQIVQT